MTTARGSATVLDMSDEQQTLKYLDDAIRDHVADILDDNEYPTTWLVIVGTVNAEGGGSIKLLPFGDTMPPWQMLGLLKMADLTTEEFLRNEEG